MRQTYSLKRSWSLSDSVTDKKHYRDETSTKFVWKTLSFQVKYGVTTKKTHMMSNSQAAKLVRGFCDAWKDEMLFQIQLLGLSVVNGD